VPNVGPPVAISLVIQKIDLELSFNLSRLDLYAINNPFTIAGASINESRATIYPE